MKKLTFCFLVLLFLVSHASADNATVADTCEMVLEINTAGNISINLDIKPGLPNDIHFKRDTLAKPLPNIELRNILTDATVVPSSAVGIKRGPKKIQLVFLVGPSAKHLVAIFSRSDQEYYIYMDDSIELLLNDGSVFVFTPDTMKEISSKMKFELTQDQTDAIINAKGGYLNVLNNRFDTGLRNSPTDTIDMSGYIDFAFARTLFSNAHAQISGLLTSDINDNIAHIKITPLAYRNIARHTVVASTFFQSSLNGREMRGTGSIFYNGIVNNLVDFTRGHNRLRPRPILSAGLSLSYYFESAEEQVEREFIVEPFVQLLYDIPIMDKYTLNLNVYAFWKINNDFDFDVENAEWNWQIAVGYDLNGTSKIITKYTYGTDPFSMETDNSLMLGFLVDLFDW